MNKPNNKRKRESIAKIESVFLERLQTKDLDEISVSDIYKGAGLNRTTFYANDTDIYALADSIRNKLETTCLIFFQEASKKIRFFTVLISS